MRMQASSVVILVSVTVVWLSAIANGQAPGPPPPPQPPPTTASTTTTAGNNNNTTGGNNTGTNNTAVGVTPGPGGSGGGSGSGNAPIINDDNCVQFEYSLMGYLQCMNDTANQLLAQDPKNESVIKDAQATVLCGNYLLVYCSQSEVGFNKTQFAYTLDRCVYTVGDGRGTGFDQGANGEPISAGEGSDSFATCLAPYMTQPVMMLTAYHVASCIVPRLLSNDLQPRMLHEKVV